MAKVRIKAGKAAVEQAVKGQDDFEQAPPGVYTAALEEAKPGHAKGEDGKPDKSRPYLECIYKIVAEGRNGDKPEKNYSRLWDYVSFGNTNTEWKVAQFGLAMELPVSGGSIDGEIETAPDKPGTVIGRKVLIRVRRDTDQDGNYRGKIASVLPLTAGTVADGGSAFDDSGEADDGPSDPFGDGEEDVTGDLLTRDALEAMDIKELGGLCTEFDLIPQDYIVKKRNKVDTEATKAAVVDAILEAQGADEGEGEENPEDPF